MPCRQARAPPPSKPFPFLHLLPSYTSASAELSPPFPPQPPANPIPLSIPPPPPQTTTPLEPPGPPLPKVKGPGLVPGPHQKSSLPPPPPKTMEHLQFAQNVPKRFGNYIIFDMPPPPPKPPITRRERLRQLLEAGGYLKEPPPARRVPVPGAENQPPDDERSMWHEVFYGPGKYEPNEYQTHRYV